MHTLDVMKRRQLIQLAALSSATAVCAYCQLPIIRKFVQLWAEDEAREAEALAEVQRKSSHVQAPNASAKSTHFAQNFADDILFSGRKFELMQTLTTKFRAVQHLAGHGNFNIMGMDEFFRLAGIASGAGALTTEEKDFLEEVFFFDAKAYGFQGDKVFRRFTDRIDTSAVVKVPFTGHFLRKGQPFELYQKIRKDIGESITLTSGVRGLAKQFHLFFEQALEVKGNMSRASRSLAPPGYSFHGNGDFDVGKRGLGLKNFSPEITYTNEYRKMMELGYVQIRYTESNLLGVRYEPWHIKVNG